VAPPLPPEPLKEEPKVEQKEVTAPPKQVRNAKPLRKVAATYPRSALKNGTTGKVKVRLTVGDGGDVIDVEILESSPPGVFDDAVTKAVKQYRFEADGSKYFVDQEVLFKLED
ncbi:MAG: energy transducer TonB, partial [Pseudomonadota bacterium]|nr:energy transducer TonB [Pseudomonadota bacterium]